MKKYFIVSAITTIICFIICVIYTINKPTSFAYYCIISSLILLSFIFFYVSRKMLLVNRIINVISNVMLLIISIPINIGLIIYIIMVITNITFEPIVKEPFKAEIGTQQQEENYYRLYKLIKPIDDEYVKFIPNNINFKKDVVRKFDYKNSKVKEVLNATLNQRNQVLEFLNKNIVAYPLALSKSTLTSDEKHLRLTLSKYLIEFIEMELIEINRLLHNGNYTEAINRYIKLWNSIDNVYKTKNLNLMSELIFISLISDIENLIDSDENVIKAKDVECLGDTYKEFSDNIDSVWINVIHTEYFSIKEDIINMKQVGDWPFYDYKRTLKMHYDYYNIVALAYKEPYYKNPSEKKMNIDKMYMQDDISSYLINPVGKRIMRLCMIQYDSLWESKEKMKSRLRAKSYILNRSNYKDIPIDNLTGKKYIFKEDKDSYEIFTEFKEEGKPLYIIKYRK